MKKAILPIFISAAACSSAADLTNIYYNGSTWEVARPLPNSPFWTQPGNQGTQVSIFSGDASQYNIVTDNIVNMDGSRLQFKFGDAGDLTGSPSEYTVGGMEFKNYTGTDNRHNIYADNRGLNVKVTVLNDITFSNNTRSDGNQCTFFMGDNMQEFNVNGNINIGDSNVIWGTDNMQQAIRKSAIGGNVNLTGDKATFQTTVGDASAGDFSNPDLKIGGKVNMNAANSTWIYNNDAYEAGTPLNSYITVGGLNGSGNLVNSWHSNGSIKKTTTIAFTNTDKSDFTGVISSSAIDWNSGDSARVMNIEMRGGENGVQILRTSRKDNAYLTSNITVYSGTLLLGNTSDRRANNGSDKYNQLVMEGGKFGAAAQSAGGDQREAYFNDILWNDGVILVDIIDIESGLVSVINSYTLTLGSANEFVFEFVNEDGGDLSGLVVDVSDFLKISGGITQEQLSKFSGKTSDGLWEAVFDASTGTVSFAAVPEPATLAAVLGAFALAFAAYRKNKR